MTVRMISFEVPGEARGKMRPKASSFGGHARVYTPSKQIEYENWVRLCFSKACPDAEPIDAPLSVSLTVYSAVPSGVSKRRRALMLENKERRTKKPDLDNVAKSILDALNGIAYRDDALIWSLEAMKLYGEEAKAVVTLTWREGDGA